MAELSKQGLIELADAKLADAKVLLESGNSANAYYLAGYTIELMLKAILSKRFQADTLPDPSWSKGVFIHDLRKLVNLALLDEALRIKLDTNAEFTARWQIVEEWNETSRYDVRLRDDAEKLIEAIEHAEHGVLPWLRTKL